MFSQPPGYYSLMRIEPLTRSTRTQSAGGEAFAARHPDVVVSSGWSADEVGTRRFRPSRQESPHEPFHDAGLIPSET